MIGQTLSHYEILEMLGAGGMGEVYRARDTSLDRDVALKVLPAELADNRERLERLEREAKALAALDHPNIVTVFSVEEADAVHFLTMAYVEGQTLDQLIPPGGLTLERCLGLAVPLADALRAAHERGIVHRDLKPGNVMVDGEDRLRVLDFGLAKLLPEAPSPEMSQLPTQAMTQEGVVLGTYPYMSPEQVEGKTADARSDIFSLGVMLYEMATGRRPFQGETPPALISSILKDSPTPVTEERPELPHHLGWVISRCLEKDPERRYQTAKDVRNELEALKKEVESGVTVPVVLAKAARPAARWGLAAASAVAVLALLVGLDVGSLRQRLLRG